MLLVLHFKYLDVVSSPLIQTKFRLEQRNVTSESHWIIKKVYEVAAYRNGVTDAQNYLRLVSEICLALYRLWQMLPSFFHRDFSHLFLLVLIVKDLAMGKHFLLYWSSVFWGIVSELSACFPLWDHLCLVILSPCCRSSFDQWLWKCCHSDMSKCDNHLHNNNQHQLVAFQVLVRVINNFFFFFLPVVR